MEQFTLEKYLENPSRKVVTRRGNPVRIICTDRKHGEDELPIVFLEECINGEFLLTCRKDGRSDNYDTQYDLFFADEEKELTEFELRLLSSLNYTRKYRQHYSDEDMLKIIKDIAKELLDLARKEVEKEITKEVEQKVINHTYAYQNRYENGKYDALKNLPKWKKAKKDEEFDCHVAIQQDGRVVLSDFVQKDEYYITLDVLKILQKEE